MQVVWTLDEHNVAVLPAADYVSQTAFGRVLGKKDEPENDSALEVLVQRCA